MISIMNKTIIKVLFLSLVGIFLLLLLKYWPVLLWLSWKDSKQPYKTELVANLKNCGTIEKYYYGLGISSERIKIILITKSDSLLIATYTTRSQSDFDFFIDSLSEDVSILIPNWIKWEELKDQKIECGRKINIKRFSPEEYMKINHNK
jgi:hypothetical protein